MTERVISEKEILSFAQHLNLEEKSTVTIEKYLRDVRAFMVYVGSSSITKEAVKEYKRNLQDKGYAIRSINSMISSLNSMFEFLQWSDCKVKLIKQQKEGIYGSFGGKGQGLRAHLQAPQKHEIRQAEPHLRTLEQRGAACHLAGGLGKRRQPFS